MRKHDRSLPLLAILALLFLLFHAVPHALADYDPGDYASAPRVSVKEAKRMPDDTKVILRGVIFQRIGEETYLFRDRTGRIRCEIDDDLLKNGKGSKNIVDPNATLELRGEVDRKGGKIWIDVDWFERIN